MSTTRSKDRAGLCSFTFANGHRCRSLRSTSHPHLCYYHARKESQARAAEQIGRDISYFFSGRYSISLPVISPPSSLASFPPPLLAN